MDEDDNLGPRLVKRWRRKGTKFCSVACGEIVESVYYRIEHMALRKKSRTYAFSMSQLALVYQTDYDQEIPPWGGSVEELLGCCLGSISRNIVPALITFITVRETITMCSIGIMQIKIFITARLESSFEMHLMDEAQDIYTALQHRIGGIRRSAGGHYRIYCIIVHLIANGSPCNVAKIYNRYGRLLGALHYSTPSAADLSSASARNRAVQNQLFQTGFEIDSQNKCSGVPDIGTKTDGSGKGSGHAYIFGSIDAEIHV
ncbi:hypothetical protein ARMSODRAFT_980643 [Armillaria solidipes]|uniref:Uncharacterized protein n=1 Tax=Armillaria solidipes TaxID=1076256 RepID=A0A2H3B6E6_9AGAR|nr:hypothetical protein ARMSODRAFT_980643 [Armillaria solidipes]